MKNIFIIILLINILISCDFKSSAEYFNDALKKEKQNDFEGAIKDLDIALKKNPDDIEALVNRAVDKKALGRYKEAMVDIDNALVLDSINILALYSRGNIFSEIKDYKNALKDYNKCIRLKGGETIYFERKNNALLELNIADVEMEAIRLQRGLSYAELSDYKKAYSDFTFCINKKYGHDLAYLWRGLCLYNLGYPDKACEDWKNAKELGMAEASTYLNESCKSEK